MRPNDPDSGRHPDLPPHRPRWQVALEMLDIADENGIAPAWVACGEDYARSAEFVAGLPARARRVLGRVSSETRSWVIVPGGPDGPDDLTLPGLNALKTSNPLR